MILFVFLYDIVLLVDKGKIIFGNFQRIWDKKLISPFFHS